MNERWDKDKVFRTTKCFGAWCGRNPYNGSFPAGFLKWVKNMGWWGEKRCHLCSGMVNDEDSVRVDIRKETNPTHLEDARHTSLLNESFDFVMIDPPYSLELSKKLYGTEKVWSGINAFTREAARICRPGGLILTLSYEIPKRISGCDFISVCGVYQVPAVSMMRCFTVSKKRQLESKKTEEAGKG